MTDITFYGEATGSSINNIKPVIAIQLIAIKYEYYM
jgi:hypothetical protein